MSDRVLERRAKHKVAVLRHVEEVSGNVAATCRNYGISRQCYYKWRRRFDEEGIEELADRSSVPHHQPTKTDPEMVEKILYCGSGIPSGRRRSRCICFATTASRSAHPASD